MKKSWQGFYAPGQWFGHPWGSTLMRFVVPWAVVWLVATPGWFVVPWAVVWLVATPRGFVVPAFHLVIGVHGNSQASQRAKFNFIRN